MAGGSVKGIKALTSYLSSAAQNVKEKKVEAEIGYSAPYAVYVHEDLQKYHSNGQAKFLEQPYNSMKPALTQMIIDSLKKGDTLSKAVGKAYLVLKAASQALVPVDTGTLRDSAYVHLTITVNR